MNTNEEQEDNSRVVEHESDQAGDASRAAEEMVNFGIAPKLAEAIAKMSWTAARETSGD